MSWQIIISALAMGLLSSVHCVGMCGAIAFSLPTQNLEGSKKIIGISLYNIGRVITYTILGVVFGLVGRQMFISGFQQWFSIIAGVFILVVLIQTVVKSPVFHLPGFAFVNKWVQQLISTYLLQPSLYSKLLLGMANGLLPCGLIYLAITGALATGTVKGAALFMAFFGAGTIPAMFLFSYFGFMLKLSTRNFMRKMVPYFVGLVAVLLILRGMGLNIPYVSPLIGGSGATTIPCH